jgi:hypothetical protein
MGWGYCPNNIPQWNFKYKVAFAILDQTDKPVKVFVDDKCEPSSWVESKPNSYEFQVRADVAPGNYKWAVAIVDTTRDNTPGIQLAVNNDVSDDGWVKLMNLKVE